MNAPRPDMKIDRDEDVRTALSVAAFKRSFLDNLFCVQARFPAAATRNDRYMALAATIRDRLAERWAATGETYLETKSRTVVYLSAEYLLGPHLGNNLLNLGVTTEVRQAMTELGLDLDDLLDQEEEPGLGNGGLGRLAACYLDSLATAELPAVGYGIRYEFGIFDQEIRDGSQAEVTDKWLRFGNPWEVARPEIAFAVPLGGRTETVREPDGRLRVRWIPDRVVKGVAHDTPVLGYRVVNTNLLRLWSAKACESFDFQAFNAGDYYGAVEDNVVSENLTKILYPNDEPLEGKQLRLEQQYFLVSCTLQDLIRCLQAGDQRLNEFPDKWVVQLNDTHPSLAVPELMRLLVDEHGMDWEPAWALTQRAFAYTNHTLLPEALEQWPLDLFARLLPRHLEIVFEINRRFLDEVRVRFPGDEARVRRMSLIDESGPRQVRMAHLATVGSFAVNGVAAMHTDLLKHGVLRDFHDMHPEKFSNKTNGVTPRRFLALGNPGLTDLVSRRIGADWIRHLDQLRALEPLAEDAEFRAEWQHVKLANKRRLARRIVQTTGVVVDPASLFDIQAKRIHEYKRQHLNLLHVITLYRQMKRDPDLDVPPRTAIFAGKAAPGYDAARLLIELVTGVADVVNNDADIQGRLKVAFLPDFNVKNSQPVYPAADLSEQISTAGYEASGTGNMKFALNGALTIGTLDGANVEIREAVGAENFFRFGLRADEVRERRAQGYRPRDHYEEDPRLREALDLIAAGTFSPDDPGRFRSLVSALIHHDPYLVLADFSAYLEAQDAVNRAYRDPTGWTRMAILNVARMGRFSSDRAVHEYARDIWQVKPVPVELIRWRNARSYDWTR